MSDAANLGGDNEDLEALFDSIAATREESPPAPAPAPAVSSQPAVGDNDDLQALFDSVAASAQSSAPAAGGAVAAIEPGELSGQDRVFQRIGNMARHLHDTLHELGYDKLLEKTVHAIPDANDRLAY
ncbi:MAG: protein phosphatase CheZ, partial [Betaproteobacteria bacterium]|nr:protein phosphatase CheZ [Betaproteobacteria bacterium]